MNLMEKLRADQLGARKAGEVVGRSVLTSLMTAAAMVGKNSGNRESTNAEVIRTIKQFVTNTNTTIEQIQGTQREDREEKLAEAYQELAILEFYLPPQLSDAKLEDAIQLILANVPEGVPPMRAVMKGLAEQYEGLYDSGKASQIAKRLQG